MKLVKKVLNVVANLTSESTSGIGFYEPKMPKELVKPEKEKQ
ncbi:MAG: cyclic lactone autoinducer peptide [Lachnospiraceae bacterium]|nr:cyclic lactone autoinducer peptide [Lachnospiraceae bacterium]